VLDKPLINGGLMLIKGRTGTGRKDKRQKAVAYRLGKQPLLKILEF
jgi:hypothetical protein